MSGSIAETKARKKVARNDTPTIVDELFGSAESVKLFDEYWLSPEGWVLRFKAAWASLLNHPNSTKSSIYKFQNRRREYRLAQKRLLEDRRSRHPRYAWGHPIEVEQAYQISKDGHDKFVESVRAGTPSSFGRVVSVYLDTSIDSGDPWVVARMARSLRFRPGNTDDAGNVYKRLIGMKTLCKDETAEARKIAMRIDQQSDDEANIDYPINRKEVEIETKYANVDEGFDIGKMTEVTVGQLANEHRDELLNNSDGHLTADSVLKPQFITLSERTMFYIRYDTKDETGEFVQFLSKFLAGEPVTQAEKDRFLVTGRTEPRSTEVIYEACLEELRIFMPRPGVEAQTLEQLADAVRNNDTRYIAELPKSDHTRDNLFLFEMEKHRAGHLVSNWGYVSSWRKIIHQIDVALEKTGQFITRTAYSKAYEGYRRLHKCTTEKTSRDWFRHTP